jgi:hypothetical protein
MPSDSQTDIDIEAPRGADDEQFYEAEESADNREVADELVATFDGDGSTLTVEASEDGRPKCTITGILHFFF